jgi:hypothetical protein
LSVAVQKEENAALVAPSSAAVPPVPGVEEDDEHPAMAKSERAKREVEVVTESIRFMGTMDGQRGASFTTEVERRDA